MLPSEVKNDVVFESIKLGNCTLLMLQGGLTPPLITVGSPSIISIGGASTAAAVGGGTEAEGFVDHEAATTCATPILLQFLRDFVLSWRTKFGGNLKIRDERPPGEPPKDTEKGFDEVDLPAWNRPELRYSGRVFPGYSGSERHSNVGKTLAQLDDTAISLSLSFSPYEIHFLEAYFIEPEDLADVCGFSNENKIN